MIRIREIVNAFQGLVGWEQSRAREYTIGEELTRSDSGLTFQDAHPMLTLRAMKGIMPKDYVYSEYDIRKTYSRGDVVAYGEELYRSIVDENTGHSVLDEEYWELYHALTEYISKLTDSGIKAVVQRFVTEKVVGLETRNIIDRRTLFDGTGRIENRTPNKGHLVGFEITPVRANGATMKIERIGLQFTGNIGKVKVYLFHSSHREPVWTKELNYTATRGTYQWFDLPETYLPYFSHDFNSGGTWYLVYSQAELPDYMESINFGRDWSREPCGTCNKGDLNVYRAMGKWVQLSPFYVNIEDWDGLLWDIADNIYTNGDNYGLNLQFSMGCDLTDTIISMRSDFANVIQKQVATTALKALAMNPEVEVNRVQFNADRNDILFETEGNGQGIRGLRGELDRAFKALSIDTRGLDPLCLTCKNGGIHIGSI
jgi:hypothetical protein|nr:MAG TPA: hypothetical protein [Caudoviricetes sp.]